MALRSYAHGGGDTPLLGVTVGQLLDIAARRWPDHDALIVVDQGVRWNWRELRERAKNFAAGLLALGLEPGDRIGMLAPNRAEWLVAQFGSAYAGLVLVNINPAYRTPELLYALDKVGCRALVTESAFKTSDYIVMLNELAPELAGSEPGELRAARLPELRIVIRVGSEHSAGMFNFDDVASRAGPKEFAALDTISRNLDFDTPINIQFTSGTTGSPKAATLTHHNIVNNASMSASIMRFTEHDRLCMPVPMYHCFGMVLGTLLCTSSGAAIVLPAAAFEAAACLAAIQDERCTAVHGVPTMFIAMLEDPGFADCDTLSLRTGIMACSTFPIELMNLVIVEMNLREIKIGYCMKETGPLSTQTLPDDPIELRVGTVGRPLPNTEIKIVDEDGHVVPRGEPGELCARGYNVMRGYWGDPERTASEIDEAHWMKSGDTATMDENDYVRIVGRSKDMLIRGGENIYPREIEEFLYTNPKIEQVEVVGVPDPKFGEEVAAWIKLHEGQAASEAEIREYCKGRLAHFKIPRYIRFVEEFPMTVTGKVQKYLIRESMAEELDHKKTA